VIPREGVESWQQLFWYDSEIAEVTIVIPREGVESWQQQMVALSLQAGDPERGS
jgi:hypothetical protein